ncbi:hypothetical protein HDV00_000944 [Rhizophlyctis rosea]|nr:hypothetical protein HDV00_000944 [Rhizophlyctis rosea]
MDSPSPPNSPSSSACMMHEFFADDFSLPSSGTPPPTTTTPTPTKPIVGLPIPRPVPTIPPPTPICSVFRTRYKNTSPLHIPSAPFLSPLTEKCSSAEYLATQILNPIQPAGSNENNPLTPESTSHKVQVMLSQDGTHFLDNPNYTSKVDMDVMDVLAGILNTPVLVTEEPGARRYYYRGLPSPTFLKDLDLSALWDTLFGTTAVVGGEQCVWDRTSVHPNVTESIPVATSNGKRPQPNPLLMRLWVSTADCITPLHYDRCHGLLIQLHGTKRFLIFPRDDAPNLYLHNGLSGPSHASKIIGSDKILARDSRLTDSDRKEFAERYPKLERTSPYVVTLQPGDILYTPPGWCHEVTSVSGSVSVTVPWDMTVDETEDTPSWMKF